MSVISSLIVSLGMNAAAFTEGANKAKSSLSSLEQSFGSIGNNAAEGANKAKSSLSSLEQSFGNVGSAVAQAVAAIGLGWGFKELVADSMRTVDATAKVADRIGTTTEALSSLQHAANLGGVGMEELHGVLERLDKTLFIAAQSGGTAAEALERLGLSAGEVSKQTPDEAFKSIAEAMSGIADPTLRAALAADIFGKQGQRMLDTLAGGKATIAAAQAEAEKLGLTFSRMEASKIEAANDAFTKLQAIIVGVGRRIAIDMAPALKVTYELTKQAVLFFREWGSTIRDVIVAVVAFRVSLLAIVTAQKAIAVAQAIVLGLTGPAGWAQLAAGAAIGAAAASTVAYQFNSIESSAASAHSQIQQTAAALQGFPELPESLKRIQNGLSDANALTNELIAQAAEVGLSDIEVKIRALKKQMGIANELGPERQEFTDLRWAARYKAEAEQAIKDEQRAKQLIDESLSAHQRFIQQQTELNALREKGLLTQQQHNELLVDAAKRRDEGMKVEREGAKTDMNRLGERLRQQVETPLQKYRKAQAEIEAAFRAGELTRDQAALLKLQGEQAFLQSQQAPGDTGPSRPAALERGTAAAFSASFGADPIAEDRKQQLRLQREQTALLRKIEQKLGIAEI